VPAQAIRKFPDYPRLLAAFMYLHETKTREIQIILLRTGQELELHFQHQNPESPQ
jgi:hypothetical protein